MKRPSWSVFDQKRETILESRLIAKDSDEHERYFQAFLDDSVVRWTVDDLFGNARVVEARVYSVQHVGNKTKFVFCKP